MYNLVFLIPLFPALGALLIGLFFSRLPKKLVGPLACATVGASAVVATLIFFSMTGTPVAERSQVVPGYDWMLAGPLHVNVEFLVDQLSIVMMMVVGWVSFLIHIYSIGYMKEDPGYNRYFSYLNLFVFFMLTLVSAGNFLMMFVGWEGVGLCSYLLIGFWYEKKSASDAGKKAFIVNRIGDFGFLVGMMIIFWKFGRLDFTYVFHEAPHVFAAGGLVITLTTLCFFLGATGKSAQIPLYVWLPDAMEGPTPVSALIHAATMVTAGVYMLARCNVIFSMAPLTMLIVAIIGGATAIYAASIGMAQNDIKRVLAYSTISQLGYMFLACGVGAFAVGIFHLMTHAFFKALLFMGAGSVMHSLSGELDMRKMGSLRKYLPSTFKTYFIATLAIAGIIPFAGFWSKDEILFRTFESSSPYWAASGKVLWFVGAAAALMTAFYMFRTVFMTFYGKSRMDPEVEAHVHESPPVMTIPLWILAILSIIGGWVAIPGVTHLFGNFLSPVTGGAVHVATEAIQHGAPEAAGHASEIASEWSMAIISMIIALVGIGIAFFFYMSRPKMPEQFTTRFPALYKLVYNKYFMDEVYDSTVVQPIKWTSEWILWKIADNILVDGTVNGVAWLIKSFSGQLRRIQTGLVQNYMVAMLLGVLAIMAYLLFY